MSYAMVMGNLTRNPEIRVSQTTTNSIASFCVAENKKDKTNFIDCVAFGSNADFAEKYLKKGSRILVGGELDATTYTNKEGKNVKSVKIIVNHYEFCGSKREQEGPVVGNTDEFMAIPDGIDELPFN